MFQPVGGLGLGAVGATAGLALVTGTAILAVAGLAAMAVILPKNEE